MRRSTIVLVCVLLVLTGCASSTRIMSNPPGAKVYLDDAFIGTTPVEHSDSAVTGTHKRIRIAMEGYREINSRIEKTEIRVGPLIAAFFFLVPGVWVGGYPEAYMYELEKQP